MDTYQLLKWIYKEKNFKKMKKHIKTIALIATGLVVGVVVGRVNGIKNKKLQ